MGKASEEILVQPRGGRDEIPERHPPSLLPAGTAAVWEVSPSGVGGGARGIREKEREMQQPSGKG